MDMVDRLIAREGGDKLVTDPFGGLTKFGISQKAYPQLDIAGLSYAQAKMLYINDYLLKTNISRLPDGLQEMVLDYAVHSGPVTAIKCLQKLLGVAQDGKIGPQTLTAAQTCPIPQVVSAMARERISYMIRQCQKTPDKLTYLNGWVMRVLNLYT